jgi:hypothetical protein
MPIKRRYRKVIADGPWESGTICGIIGSYPASTAPDQTGWEGASGFGTVVPGLLQWL